MHYCEKLLLIFKLLWYSFHQYFTLYDIYNKCIKVTSKLHKTSSSFGFIKKALHHNVTPTFAKIRGQFVNNKDELDAERKLMISHLNQHDLKLKEITNKHRALDQELVKKVGSIRYKILLKHMSSSLQWERLFSFKTKNKKLEVLISKAHKREKVSGSYKTPFINLSHIELTLEESKQLNLGLEYSFVDKNKNIKKFLAANFESIADRITDNL